MRRGEAVSAELYERFAEPVYVQMRKRRRSMGLTQVQVAERIGCAELTVQNWESGKTVPNIESLDGWAKALDLSVVLVPVQRNDPRPWWQS